jgi:Protein of unknwon function (DUF3310)
MDEVVPITQEAWNEIIAPERRQVGGTHYNSHAIQPFDVIVAYGMDFFEGSAVKYLMRYKDKNGVEDLEKARHYIDILIAREKGVEEWWKA